MSAYKTVHNERKVGGVEPNRDASPVAQARYLPPIDESDEVYVRYSDIDDEISVSSGYVQLKGDLFNGLIMAPSLKVRGKRLAPPKLVLFEFASFFTNTDFHSMSTIRIVGDGKLVFESPIKIVSRGEPVEYGQTRNEEAEVEAPYRVFEHLCDSKQIEISVADTTFAAPDQLLLKLRAIRKRVAVARHQDP